MIKLIALDLDGTLYNSRKEITPVTRAALRKIAATGVKLVLASGRPAPGLQEAAGLLGFARHGGGLISYNGGQVQDYLSERVVYKNAIDRQIARQLVAHLANYSVTPIVEDGERIYTDNPAGFQIQHESVNNRMPVERVVNVVQAIDFDPVKVLIAAPAERLQPLVEAIKQPFAEQLDFVLSAPCYLEATAKGVSKATALARLCQEWGIAPHEIMAFGDAENDKAMLEYAGLGVAMGNATESVKAIARMITASNDADGIAQAIERVWG